MRSVTGRTGWIRIGEIIARAWRTEAGSWFQTRKEAYRKNDLLFVQKMMCRWKSECDQRWRASVARRLNSDEVMQIGGLVGCYALSTCLGNTQYTVTPKTLIEFYVCCCNQKVWSLIEIKWSHACLKRHQNVHFVHLIRIVCYAYEKSVWKAFLWTSSKSILGEF